MNAFQSREVSKNAIKLQVGDKAQPSLNTLEKNSNPWVYMTQTGIFLTWVFKSRKEELYFH